MAKVPRWRTRFLHIRALIRRETNFSSLFQSYLENFLFSIVLCSHNQNWNCEGVATVKEECNSQLPLKLTIVL